MVTSTAGLACDTSTTKENRETQNTQANSNEYNELKKKTGDKSVINPIEKIATKNNDISSTMSNNSASVNNELNSEAGTIDAATASSTATDYTADPLTNGSVSSPSADVPVHNFASTSHSNYGPYNQNSMNSQSKPGQNLPNFHQPSMQSRFPANQPSSATPTLNQLLATPARFPAPTPDASKSLNSQEDIARVQRQSWEQDPSQQGERTIAAVPNPEPTTNIPVPQPPVQSDYFPSPSQGYPPNHNRYPNPSGHQMPPYSQGQQYNPTMPPPPGGSSYPYPPTQHGANPYQNPPQSHYYGRHANPGQAGMGSPRNAPPPIPQHPPDPSFQHPKERMMSPNRPTPQPSAVPSPMSAGSSPHMQGPLSSLSLPHNQSPSRNSPALTGTPNATPLSPGLVRPQQSPTVRGVEMQDRPPSAASATGYPNTYRPATPLSPYPSQGPTTPHTILSPPQAPYPGAQQHTNIPAPPQAPMPSAAPLSGGQQMQPVSTNSSQPYQQAGQPHPMNQQPGGHPSPQYNNASQQPQFNQGYNAPLNRRPSSGPASQPPAVGGPGHTVRRGAAAAAAAAMAAAAHSAQPGHVPRPRYPTPNYYAPQQPRHPNYNNVQPSSDTYQHQRPYAQAAPPRVPASPRQSPGVQNNYKVPPPAPQSYRQTPPQQYSGHYPASSTPSNPPFSSGYQNTGGYKPYQPHDEAAKKAATRSIGSFQKLGALYEPTDEPGRREFVDAVLKYWTDKDLPLKHAPLMGKRTLDLFRLYHLVKQNGGMQEVTSGKKWPEISTMLGLGTTSSSGFTLKKQYCKYLYGYECRVERGQPEPQEAMARFTEAHRKKKQAVENAHDDGRMASMPLHGPPGQHGAPQQYYPRGNYPYNQQYRPPAPPGSNQGGYMMPRTATPANSYPGYPNNSGATVHHTNMPPAQTYPQPSPSSYNQWPQGQQTPPTSTYPPFSTALSQPSASLPPTGLSASVATSSQPFMQQQTPLPIPASINTSSSLFPPASTASTPTITGTLAPYSSMTSSQHVPPIPTPTSYFQSTATTSHYSYTPSDTYRPLPASLIPSNSSYPSSKSPLSTSRLPSNPPYFDPSHSPSPRQTMPYLPKSVSPMRPSPPRTPNFPSSPSPGLKRSAMPPAGPPNKMFRHNVSSAYPPGSSSPRAEYSRRGRPSRASYPRKSSSPLLQSVPPPQRGPYSHRLPPYRSSTANTYRYPSTRPLQRWPPNSITSRARNPMPFSSQKMQLDPRASLRRQYMLHRAPMSQQFKREYMYFPPNSVEATPLRLAKYQRKTSGSVGLVEGWRLIMALKSGLLVESSWALNVLNIFLYDQTSVAQFRLSQLPGLLDALVEHYRRYLMEIFYLPSELIALGIDDVAKVDPKPSIENDSALEEVALIKHLRLLSKNCQGKLNLEKLNSKFVKKSIKVESRGSSFLVDKSHHWDYFEEKSLSRNLSHIVLNLETNTVKKFVKTEHDSSTPDQLPALDITLEDLLSIPCTVLCPDVYDIMKSSIEIMLQEEKEVEKHLEAITKSESKDVEKEDQEERKSYSFEHGSPASDKTESTPIGVKSETISNGEVDEASNIPTPNVKIEEDSSHDGVDAKKPCNTIKHPYNNKNSGDGKKNNLFFNGVKEEDFDERGQLLKEVDQPKTKRENNTKENDTCKSEVTDSEIVPQTLSLKQEPRSPCENGDPREEGLVTLKENNKLVRQPKIELPDDTKSTTPQNSKNDFKIDLKSILKQKIINVEERNEKSKPVLPEDYASKDVVDELESLNLVVKAKQILEERNVLLVEDESYGRDGCFSDPLSGPLLCSETSLSRNELSNRLRSVSNILRSLSFIPWNMTDICRHPALMTALSGILLLRHKHRRKRKRKLNFDDEDDAAKETQVLMKDETPEKTNDLKNPSFQLDANANLKENNASITSSHSSLKDEAKEEIAESLFASKEDLDTGAKQSSEKFSSVVLDRNNKDEDDVFSDTWWWDVVQRIREDALIVLSNVASNLDLSLLPDNHVPLAIIEACIHLVLCNSSDACEPFSLKPRYDLSAQRSSLEILTKLSIKEENVQLIIAIRPLSKLEKLFAFLIGIISDRKDQILQEFAIVLLSNLSRNDVGVARLIALQNSSISCLVAFLESCEEVAMNNRQLLRLQSGVTNCGTTEFMMCKAARALHTMASVTENKPKFMKYQLRLLALSMSQLLGNHVTSTISSVLFELTHDDT